MPRRIVIAQRIVIDKRVPIPRLDTLALHRHDGIGLRPASQRAVVPIQTAILVTYITGIDTGAARQAGCDLLGWVRVGRLLRPDAGHNRQRRPDGLGSGDAGGQLWHASGAGRQRFE